MRLCRGWILKNRSQWKNQSFHYPHASSFHNSLRNIFLTDSFFKQLNCFQEVTVKSLIPAYPNNFDAVDWYIDELNTIIELHGKQHYEQQSFGSKDSYFNQRKNFNNIKYRDNRKKTYLTDAGFNYIEISYKDKSKLNAEYIKTKLFD